MRPILYPSILLAALLGLSQCKQDAPSPLSQLPPATQTGANTFGCLVNGKPWTPQGYSGAANYSVSYDRVSTGGVLDVRAYRIYGSTTTESQYIVLFGA
ncbi:hypothetical protein J0X19_03115 [Hymenobacter sp. BT186]|uniref:Uncharacterized protein n=1 Tax=Hymenobacter telluris TaxID=2816474 RepID=A0A939ESE4_9BACT|nr:hypothetical protein [Hymenobacter telluris]MBO0356924.1 hypothetical protein [Hymenobacter telluris]MBW3372951.1 hypothetical protein [Hymenobacter norwichensis]